MTIGSPLIWLPGHRARLSRRENQRGIYRRRPFIPIIMHCPVPRSAAGRWARRPSTGESWLRILTVCGRPP